MPDTIETGGESTGTPAPTGAPGGAALPTGGPLVGDPVLPGSQNQYPPAPLPPSWQNQLRIIKMILLIEDPVLQQEIMAFVRSKLF